MKIALFVHCFFPDHFYGTETYTFDLARNLRALGHEPIVVTGIFQGEPKKEKIVTYYEYDGIPVFCIDKNYLPNLRFKDTYYQSVMRSVLRDLLLTIRPDIIHVTHLVNHTAVLLEVADDLKIPIMASLTDFYGFCFTSILESADGTLCEGPNSKRTNCLACLLKAVALNPAENMIARLAGTYPFYILSSYILSALSRVPRYFQNRIFKNAIDIVQRPDILLQCYSKYRAVICGTKFLGDRYIANGLTVPSYHIRFGVDLPRIPKRTKGKEDPIAFGFIGQIAKHKGTDLLVEAFCRLPEGKAELHIYGQAEQSPQLMEKMLRRAADSNVSFHGTFPKEKMGDILADLDFLCIPSIWYENSPLVLLNALASHTPVIVSDVAGMTEFVEAGVNGYIFSRGDVGDLERVLRMVVADPESARLLTHTTEYARTTELMTRDVVNTYNAITLSSCEIDTIDPITETFVRH